MLSYLVTTDGGKRMSEIYDIAILGAGPAGISAAIYAARAKMNILWLDKQFAQGGQVLNTIRECRESVGWILVRLWEHMRLSWELNL